MIKISVPSSVHYISSNDYSIDFTDFDMLDLPLPNLGLEGGADNDVIISFQDENNIHEYVEQLKLYIADKPENEIDFLKNKKIDRLLKSIQLYFELNETIALFKSKTFKEINSNIRYSFISENTLSTSTNVKTNYFIRLRNDKIFLDTNPKLYSEQLEINVTTDNLIQLLLEFSHEIKLVLREE